MFRTITATLSSVFLTATLVAGPHSVTPIKAADMEGSLDWVLICATGGVYFLNLKTGERRDSDAPGQSNSFLACHGAIGRRDNDKTEN
jgi:hypothetical protein